MKQIPIKNSVMLLLAATIWGIAFVAQRVGMDYMGPFTFSAIRFIIGSVILIPVMLLLRRVSEVKQRPAGYRKDTILGGLLCGVILCIASNLQQFGLLHTSVGKTGFITVLYIMFVPLLGLFVGKKVGLSLWVSVGIAVVGMYLLCMTGSLSLNLGDQLVLVSALVFSFHILVIDHFSPRGDGVMISSIQFLVSGVLSAVCALIFEELPTLDLMLEAWVPLLYAGILSCGVAYTFQILGQKNMNPTVASLILSLESVLSVIAAWIILGQEMSPREILGAALMFAAIILAQISEGNRVDAPEKRLARESGNL